MLGVSALSVSVLSVSVLGILVLGISVLGVSVLGVSVLHADKMVKFCVSKKDIRHSVGVSTLLSSVRLTASVAL